MKLPLAANVAIFAFPLFFHTMWSLNRFRAYFDPKLTLELATQDFIDTVFPADNATIERMRPGVRNLVVGATDRNNIKFITTRIHVGISTVLAFLVISQLIPYFRNRFPKTHKKIGYIISMMFIPFMAELGYTLFIKGMVDMGKTVEYTDFGMWIGLALSFPLGIMYAKQGRYVAHRTAMILMSSFLFMIPAQRFLWVTVTKKNFGQPWMTWREYTNTAAALSQVLASSLCLLVAAAYIYMGPSKGLVAWEKSVRAKKVA